MSLAIGAIVVTSARDWLNIMPSPARLKRQVLRPRRLANVTLNLHAGNLPAFGVRAPRQ